MINPSQVTIANHVCRNVKMMKIAEALNVDVIKNYNISKQNTLTAAGGGMEIVKKHSNIPWIKINKTIYGPAKSKVLFNYYQHVRCLYIVVFDL